MPITVEGERGGGHGLLLTGGGGSRAPGGGGEEEGRRRRNGRLIRGGRDKPINTHPSAGIVKVERGRLHQV